MVWQDPNPIAEIAVGATGLMMTIFMHGVGIRRLLHISNSQWARFTTHTPAWHVNMLFATVIAALVSLHLAETLTFMLPIYLSGMMPSARDAYYFVLGSYTTVGSADVVPPESWRLIGPIIAMAGLFTFGWTVSLLVSIMADIARFDRARAKRGVRDHED